MGNSTNSVSHHCRDKQNRLDSTMGKGNMLCVSVDTRFKGIPQPLHHVYSNTHTHPPTHHRAYIWWHTTVIITVCIDFCSAGWILCSTQRLFIPGVRVALTRADPVRKDLTTEQTGDLCKAGDTLQKQKDPLSMQRSRWILKSPGVLSSCRLHHRCVW